MSIISPKEIRFNCFMVEWLLWTLNISYCQQFQKNRSRKRRISFHQPQNDCSNKFNNIRKTDSLLTNSVLTHLCGKGRSNRNFFFSSQHNNLHHSIPQQFPDPRCPKQGIFLSFTVQTLVLLSSNIQSVGWSYNPVSMLPIVIWSFNVDNGGYQRGQTSRPVVGAEIQTNCNVKVNVYHYSYLLDSIHSCFIILYFWSTSCV